MPYDVQQNENKINLPFYIPNRKLFALGVLRGGSVADTDLTLETIRDKLKAQHTASDPEDHTFPMSRYHIDLTGGVATAFLKTPNGIDKKNPLHFTQNGYAEVMKEICPSRGGEFLRETALRLGEGGSKLATLTACLWASKAEKTKLVRTARCKVEDQIIRTIRAVKTDRYAIYDNYEFIQDLLDNTEFGNLPVLSFNTTDASMRIRFADCSRDQIELNKPIRMFEAWNSEIGKRSTGIRAGMWKLVCTNGMGTYDSKDEFTWRHFGKTERIKMGVRDVLETLRMKANGVIEAYNMSLDTTIDDAFAFMEDILEPRIKNNSKLHVGIIDSVRTSMLDESSSKFGTLAGVVDGMTLAAQGFDLLTQLEVEREANKLMRRGLSQANNKRIKVLA